jgi:hypothetical protein
MTSHQANSISIKDFLLGMNISPKNVKSCYGMYYSPFRGETAPSFKVDYRKNLWYDFGSGEGGTMVDMVMKLYQCSFHEAMKKLESGNMPTVVLPEKPVMQPNETILRDVLPLRNNALSGYLSQRGINMDTARSQCVEVHYSVGKKRYYATGFRNDAGGYELRNRYFKGSVSPKSITTFTLPTNDCMIFEGFMDYLSHLTINQQLQPQTDTVVLNSVVHLKKAMNFLNSHRLVHAYLDNDTAGKQALEEICREHGSVNDMSVNYQPYKDLNEYLVQSLNSSNSLNFN